MRKAKKEDGQATVKKMKTVRTRVKKRPDLFKFSLRLNEE